MQRLTHSPCPCGARAFLRPSYHAPTPTPPPPRIVQTAFVPLHRQQPSQLQPQPYAQVVQRINQGPASIQVQVPNMQQKMDWKLNGQGLVCTLPFPDPVCVVHAKRHGARAMPAGKQNLQCVPGAFIQDSIQLSSLPRRQPGLREQLGEEVGGTCCQVPASAVLPLPPRPLSQAQKTLSCAFVSLT